MIKYFRKKKLKKTVKEIALEIGCHEKTLFKVEKNLNKNISVKYIIYLLDNGITKAELKEFL